MKLSDEFLHFLKLTPNEQAEFIPREGHVGRIESRPRPGKSPAYCYDAELFDDLADDDDRLYAEVLSDLLGCRPL